METLKFRKVEVGKVDFTFIENNLIIEDFYNGDYINEEQLEQLTIDIIKELALLEFDYLNFDNLIIREDDLVDDEKEDNEKWGEFMKNIDQYLESLNIRDYILKQSELCKTLKILVEDDIIFYNHIEPLYIEEILNTYYLK